MTGPTTEAALREYHVRREDLHEGSALTVDPPYASLDVFLRQDVEAALRSRPAPDALVEALDDEGCPGCEICELATELAVERVLTQLLLEALTLLRSYPDYEAKRMVARLDAALAAARPEVECLP